MTHIRRAVRDFVSREDGAALVEYAVLLVLVAIACIVAAAYMGQSISKLFTKSGQQIENM